jgi:hypothetical protein
MGESERVEQTAGVVEGGAGGERGAGGAGGDAEGGGRGVEGITFNAAAGSAIMFDYRILHRGLANESAISRPMLYFTYGRQWFRDATNYPTLSIWE